MLFRIEERVESPRSRAVELLNDSMVRLPDCQISNQPRDGELMIFTVEQPMPQTFGDDGTAR
jgi:hypothetical protein